MKQLLAEYWPWLLVPCLLVVAGLVWLASSNQQPSGIYPIF